MLLFRHRGELIQYVDPTQPMEKKSPPGADVSATSQHYSGATVLRFIYRYANIVLQNAQARRLVVAQRSPTFLNHANNTDNSKKN